MISVEVKSKEELKSAINNKIDCIIINGELSKKIKRSYMAKKILMGILIFLGAVSFVTHFVGNYAMPDSFIVVGISLILGIIFFGLALIIKLIEPYDIELSLEPNRVIFRKKRPTFIKKKN